MTQRDQSETVEDAVALVEAAMHNAAEELLRDPYRSRRRVWLGLRHDRTRLVAEEMRD